MMGYVFSIKYSLYSGLTNEMSNKYQRLKRPGRLNHDDYVA